MISRVVFRNFRFKIPSQGESNGNISIKSKSRPKDFAYLINHHQQKSSNTNIYMQILQIFTNICMQIFQFQKK